VTAETDQSGRSQVSTQEIGELATDRLQRFSAA
jgi:hypothetical protein